MLLTISTTHRPARDLGYLLHKNPDRRQSFDLPFGQAHVFYPQADEERCTAALLLDIDPVGLVRGSIATRTLFQYVNDRPYVASSFLSVAISRVFGTALGGRSKERPQLAERPIPLEARLAALPCPGGEAHLKRLFEPLGYRIEASGHPLDPAFPEWGSSSCLTVGLQNEIRLSELLSHLYVLIPVLDGEKHYWIGQSEVEKLLRKGKKWLASHPEREYIARRYLKYQPSMARQALERLASEEAAPDPQELDRDEEQVEAPLSLAEQRMRAVVEQLKASGAKSVADLGCGEGNLLRRLLRIKQFERITGLDVSLQTLERAAQRLKLERLSPRQRQRIELLHGALTYCDARLQGFDAAAAVEVVEHIDPPRLSAFEHSLFAVCRPRLIVLTTPNREYNVRFETLAAGKMRHSDHRFEWTRQEFRDWAEKAGGEYGYQVRFEPVGPQDEQLGPPTQMALFERSEG